MAVTDYLPGRKEATDDAGGKLPKEVKERLRRGKEAMLKDSSKRRMLYRFWRGDQYCWVDTKGVLQFQPTATNVDGSGKPDYRIRTTRNFIKGRVQGKVSSATNRTPGYDISPATTDPEDASAARLSQKAAFAGYDRWGIRKARVKTVTNALVADGGFAMPYFDPNVGPFHPVDGRQVGEGEIKVWVGNGNQVAWEAGCDFDDSPWHAIFRAFPISEVKNWPGFDGKDLKPDAATSDVPTDRASENMVLVAEFFERPCPDYPEGRKLTIANDRVIRPVESYPCRDATGQVVDEPVIHQLVWVVDPDRDRDLGMVEDLIDAQRTLNDCVSKQSEWKNRSLNPQLLALKNSIDAKDAPTDEPGRILWYKTPGQPPQWQPTPPVPRELFEMADQAKTDIKDLAFDVDVDAGSNVAARTVQAVIEQSANQWASFLAALAEFDSRLMRHCLYLCARFYTEPRLMKLRGHFGWESINDFRGADIRGQTDVRVLPDSLVSKTRAGIREEVQFWITAYPGAIPLEVAMAAYHGGLAETLIQSWELDVARANEIIKAIRGGPDVLFSMPAQIQTVPDPVTGQPTEQEVPWWMPGPSDNIKVWKEIVGSWMKTPEYRELEPGMQAAAREIYNGLLDLELQHAARQAQMQSQIAADQGLQNAAAPQTKAMPSQPAQTNGAGT